jgi:hypothetical protein
MYKELPLKNINFDFLNNDRGLLKNHKTESLAFCNKKIKRDASLEGDNHCEVKE